MAVLRVHLSNVGQRLSSVLIVAVMAAVVVAMFAAPSRAADQTWSDVSTTINGLIDEGVSTFKAGDAKGGKDKVNDAYYKHYEITGMEKQVMARISGSRVSQVEMEFSLLKKAMSDADSAGVDSHATTLKQYMVEDGASLDGVAPGSAAQARGARSPRRSTASSRTAPTPTRAATPRPVRIRLTRPTTSTTRSPAWRSRS